MSINTIEQVLLQTGLPIVELLPKLRQAISQTPNLVLQAEPGAGKTTLVPLCLLDSLAPEHKIVVLEPRRLAAKTAAARMAALLDEPVGQTVGYRVRNEKKVSARTRIEVVTEGVFCRWIQAEPELEQVGLVIFDEFHERSLQADLALALVTEVQQALRDDLQLIIMSATLDGKAIQQHLSDSQFLYCPGRTYPVAVEHVAPPSFGGWRDLLLPVVERALSETEGDVLVFLPGVAEIRWAEKTLGEKQNQALTLTPLYGDMPLQQQQQALQPVAGQRRIILATNIAETSITIEGIDCVIDSGLCRQLSFDIGSGLDKLQTRRISRASAEQRAGRAGRLSQGKCYRLWAKSDLLQPQTEPEIQRVDLASFALELANWGVQDTQQLVFLDQPKPSSMQQAHTLLHQLDALEDKTISALGRQMLALGAHPRLAHMLCQANDALWSACLLAALIEERDVLPAEQRDDPDITLRLDYLSAPNVATKPKGVAARILQQANRWFTQLRTANDEKTLNHKTIGRLLALAYPDRLAQKVERGYRLRNGRMAELPKEQSLAHEFIIVAKLSFSERKTIIRQYAEIDTATIETLFESQVTTEYLTHWDNKTLKLLRQRKLDALVFDSTRVMQPEPHLITQGMLQAIRQQGLDALNWNETTTRMLARLQTLQWHTPELADFPDCSPQALLDSLEDWLLPFINGVNRLEKISADTLQQALLSRLPWEQQQELEQLAPNFYIAPSGSKIKIDYSVIEKPILAVKLQEMFGETESPCIAKGKIRLTLHLLSPARRPLQVTDDLKSFWNNSYHAVKKEMKGRYPKHPWPDDPMQAVATRLTKKQMQRTS